MRHSVKQEKQSKENLTLSLKHLKFNFTKKQIFESFGINMDDLTAHTNKAIEQKITPDTRRCRRTRPFEAPKKFKD